MSAAAQGLPAVVALALAVPGCGQPRPGASRAGRGGAVGGQVLHPGQRGGRVAAPRPVRWPPGGHRGRGPHLADHRVQAARPARRLLLRIRRARPGLPRSRQGWVDSAGVLDVTPDGGTRWTRGSAWRPGGAGSILARRALRGIDEQVARAGKAIAGQTRSSPTGSRPAIRTAVARSAQTAVPSCRLLIAR